MTLRIGFYVLEVVLKPQLKSSIRRLHLQGISWNLDPLLSAFPYFRTSNIRKKESYLRGVAANFIVRAIRDGSNEGFLRVHNLVLKSRFYIGLITLAFIFLTGEDLDKNVHRNNRESNSGTSVP